MADTMKPVSVMMCGTGEYTTGYVHTGGSKSDKKVGVVGLCMFELRRLGKVANVGMVGTTGKKYPGIREHLKKNISEVYGGLDTSFESFPTDDVAKDYEAYKAALDSLSPGDACTIFTPDDTHFDIAKYAIERGIHVLVTKPPVKTVKEHMELVELAKKHNVFVMVEYHKRWDPIYADARNRARTLGDFSYYNSFMSQPKFQLETFKAWAGKSSDISYYLNSHHIDVHCWAMQEKALPQSVLALGATGVASGEPYGCPKGTEDTITLMTEWKNLESGNTGTAIYTASWSAPKADVHSQQRFHYMGHGGELVVDQAHRGYTACTDKDGFASINPLYMSYLPGPDGHFNGQHGYGFKSMQSFVEACASLNAKKTTLEQLDFSLPTLKATVLTTAILEAGRVSLDTKQRVYFQHGKDGNITLQVGKKSSEL